jgi:hypothetical protein
MKKKKKEEEEEEEEKGSIAHRHNPRRSPHT